MTSKTDYAPDYETCESLATIYSNLKNINPTVDDLKQFFTKININETVNNSNYNYVTLQLDKASNNIKLDISNQSYPIEIDNSIDIKKIINELKINDVCILLYAYRRVIKSFIESFDKSDKSDISIQKLMKEKLNEEVLKDQIKKNTAKYNILIKYVETNYPSLVDSAKYNLNTSLRAQSFYKYDTNNIINIIDPKKYIYNPENYINDYTLFLMINSYILNGKECTIEQITNFDLKKDTISDKFYTKEIIKELSGILIYMKILNISNIVDFTMLVLQFTQFFKLIIIRYIECITKTTINKFISTETIIKTNLLKDYTKSIDEITAQICSNIYPILTFFAYKDKDIFEICIRLFEFIQINNFPPLSENDQFFICLENIYVDNYIRKIYKGTNPDKLQIDNHLFVRFKKIPDSTLSKSGTGKKEYNPVLTLIDDLYKNYKPLNVNKKIFEMYCYHLISPSISNGNYTIEKTREFLNSHLSSRKADKQIEEYANELHKNLYKLKSNASNYMFAVSDED